MRQRTLERDSADDDLLKAFGPITSYADLERKEAIQARQESRLEKYKSPMRAELESHFESLGYEPLSLPPPLPKALSAIIRPPYGRHPLTPEVEPFTTACQEGTLDIVKYWVREKRDVLRQVGLQHGLAFASWKDQINVVRYLLGEGAVLDGAVIELACSNLSLPLFRLAVEHGYHPNQQIPSINGSMSTAINHCLVSFEITQFLLANGADPDLGPWLDTRCRGWGDRATPPMDRQSGIALDKAVRQGYLDVAELLLRFGAHVNYSRPIHELIARKAQDWQLFMDMLCHYGVDVDSTKAAWRSPSCALHYAVDREMWDLAEYLIEHGADPYKKSHPDGIDAFEIAARVAGKSSSDALGNSVNPLSEIFERAQSKQDTNERQEVTTTKD